MLLSLYKLKKPDLVTSELNTKKEAISAFKIAS